MKVNVCCDKIKLILYVILKKRMFYILVRDERRMHISVQLFSHNMQAYKAAKEMLDKTYKAAVIHPTGTSKSYISFIRVRRIWGSVIYGSLQVTIYSAFNRKTSFALLRIIMWTKLSF